MILTTVKIFQFLHTPYCISKQYVMYKEENLIIRNYKHIKFFINVYAQVKRKESMINMTNRIKQLREEVNMTQVRLSIELEVSQETISAYENGKHYPSVTALLKLSEIFHASCDYILGLSEVRYPQTNTRLTLEESQLLNKWKSLDNRKKELLCAYLDGLISGM